MDLCEILHLDGTVHLTTTHGEASYDAGGPAATLCGVQARRPALDPHRKLYRRIQEGRTCLGCQGLLEPGDRMVESLFV